MGITFRLETQAGQERVGGTLSDVRDGAVSVLAADGGDEPQVALKLEFTEPRFFFLGHGQARRLAEMLRAHATLAQGAMPWQPDEEPSGKPTKARYGQGRDAGWIQCWTPWPPPEPPQVWLTAKETVVLGFAQAIDLAQALEDTAGRQPA